MSHHHTVFKVSVRATLSIVHFKVRAFELGGELQTRLNAQTIKANTP